MSRPVPPTLRYSSRVAESWFFGSFRVFPRAEWCSALVIFVVVVVVFVVVTLPLHEGDGDRGRALEGAGYRVSASSSSASQTLTILHLRPSALLSTPRPSCSDVPCPQSQCFKSFAASAEHRRWRLSRLENGLRIFEEDESREVESSSPHPTSISTPASKVRRPLQRVSSTVAHTAPAAAERRERFSTRPRATKTCLVALGFGSDRCDGREAPRRITLTGDDTSRPMSRPRASQGVGLIFSHPEFVFNLLMDLGKSRSHWDLTFDHGEVVERLADNSDIIRVTFRKQVCPALDTIRHLRHASPRVSIANIPLAVMRAAQFSSLSFRLRRSWCCDADGSFTIALTSVKDPKVRRTHQSIRTLSSRSRATSAMIATRDANVHPNSATVRESTGLGDGRSVRRVDDRPLQFCEHRQRWNRWCIETRVDECMPCDERDEGAERRMVRVVTDIGCALCVTRARRRAVFGRHFLLTSDPRHRRWCSFSSTCSVCSSRRSERVLRAYVRHGAILHPNILFLATQRARAIL